MKLKTLYDLAVRFGIKSDPRPNKEIYRELRKRELDYKKLSKNKKKEFDVEALYNPYPDTRILHGDPCKKIKDVLVGIDIDTSEILLADSLRSKGKNIDLLISHHPQGIAYAGFWQVMQMQRDLLSKAGLSEDIIKLLLEERMKEVERKVLSLNHNKSVDAARLLGLPFMCLHTVADNCVYSYIQSLLDKNRPKRLKDVVQILKTQPEYRESFRSKAGPKIIIGKPDDKAGKILVEMTGGTEGPRQIYARLSQAGINTLVSMHLSEEHFKNAKKEKINAIIAGHISSDTLGLNLLLDKIEQSLKEKLNVINCSGFRRIRRKIRF